MSRKDVRKSLLEYANRQKIVRMNNGKSYRISNVEHWALDGGTLVVARQGKLAILAVRNISSIHLEVARPGRARA